jgi:hypothetical protein
MSSTIGGKTSKSERKVSHTVQLELRLTYAVHLFGREYLAEIDLTRWKLTTRHQEELGFYAWLIGPLKFATMNRAVYDKFIDEKFNSLFGSLQEGIEDKLSRMDPVAPHDVPPADQLN